jgi:hypothetical protein
VIGRSRGRADPRLELPSIRFARGNTDLVGEQERFSSRPANGLAQTPSQSRASPKSQVSDRISGTHSLIASHRQTSAEHFTRRLGHEASPSAVWEVGHHSLGRLATALGRYDDADAHFRAAADAHQRLQAPYLLASTRVAWAEMLARRANEGDKNQARDLAQQAATVAA